MPLSPGGVSPPGWIPITGPAVSHLVLNRWVSPPCQPMELFTQVNHILPWEQGVAHPLVTTKPAPTAPLVRSAPGCDFQMPLRGTQHREALTHVTNKPVSTASVQGWLSCAGLSCITQDGGCLLQQGDWQVIRMPAKGRPSSPWVLGARRGLDNHPVLCFPERKRLSAYSYL